MFKLPKGYVAIPTWIADAECFRYPVVRDIFIFMLLKSSKGICDMTISEISDELMYSVPTVSKALALMENEGVLMAVIRKKDYNSVYSFTEKAFLGEDYIGDWSVVTEKGCDLKA